jgi:beta-glucosidase/6-phospho-beta-glucosidase/beta-galactosidase
MITEELIEEAKIRFPIGCKFKNNNIIPGCDSINTVATDKHRAGFGYTIIIDGTNKGTYSVYCDSKQEWAIRTDITQEIIPLIWN